MALFSMQEKTEQLFDFRIDKHMFAYYNGSRGEQMFGLLVYKLNRNK